MLVLQGSPEVQGSKFVIGAVIPGSNNQATKEDVFVVVHTFAHLKLLLMFTKGLHNRPNACADANHCLHPCHWWCADLSALPSNQEWEGDQKGSGAAG